MARFSSIRTGVFRLYLSDSCQTHFQAAFGFKLKAVIKSEMVEFLHDPRNYKEPKSNLNVCFLIWLKTFAGKVDWLALLKEECTKTFQYCIC